jgi:hypothetical protein
MELEVRRYFYPFASARIRNGEQNQDAIRHVVQLLAGPKLAEPRSL